MGIIAFEIAIVFVLIVINGLFSMSELAVVSARRARLQPLAEKGNRGAQEAIDLAANPRPFLSTVQIGITLVGILAGAFGGATIAGILGEQLTSLPVVGPYGQTAAFVAVVLVITYFSIVIGELIPKSFALSSPEKIAVAVSRPMKMISRLAAPFVWLLSVPTTFVLRMLRVHASVDPPVTDEEIIGLIEAGTRAGVFEETEQEMFESVIELGEQRVTSVMTPRTKIMWLDPDDPLEELKRQVMESPYSRLPVARGRLDNIAGYVNSKGLLRHLLSTGRLEIEAVLRQPIYVPESVTVLELLEMFRESASHLAVIVDEHGGVEGVVTMHDLLQAIVGDLAGSPHYSADPRIMKNGSDSLLLDGRLPVNEFKEVLDLDELPDEERNAYQTVAGFALARLGRLPQLGDRFRWGGFEFEIRSMDGRRVSTVVAKRLAEDGISSDPVD